MDEARATDIQTMERLARLEAEVKAAFKRIDEQKTLTDSVHSLALSVERLASAQNNMETKLTSVVRDVSELKERPAKRWDNTVWLVISAVVGAVVGYIIRVIGLG